MAQSQEPRISIVLPARDEAENLAVLIPEIVSALGPVAHEIVVVDDGSTDDTGALVDRLAGVGVVVRRLVHPKSLGQSAAVMSGARVARAPIVVTLDADGQNDPRFIPELVRPFADPGIGLVAGQRIGRKSSFSKKMGSRIANSVRRGLLKDDTRDTGCGVKAFRREPFLTLPYFQGMHRYLPALFLGDGWRISHIDVVDRPRHHGASHYGILDRLAVGIVDLFGVWWLLRRRLRSPFRTEHGQ